MPSILRSRIGSLCAALAASVALSAQATDALPALHADPGRTSVSGLSSGAFMTVQYGVAYSSSVIGLGVIAGGPYYCAYMGLLNVASCMSGSPSAGLSWQFARNLAAAGQVDPVAGLARLKVYLFSGKKDDVVKTTVMNATNEFFVDAGVPKKNLDYVHTLKAGHAFIAPSFGLDCGETAPPYIEHCPSGGAGSVPYDQPQAVLQHIYGPLQPPADTLSAAVQPFDQRAFANEGTSMDAVGYVYIPKACAGDASGCAVHVVFHGCKQGAESVGDDVYAQVGYNRWADTNRIVVLYPQAVKSPFIPYNPEGCWDWWGYTGLTFQTRSGVQLSAVKAMVDRLTGQP